MEEKEKEEKLEERKKEKREDAGQRNTVLLNILISLVVLNITKG